ncbi:MAG TPA: Gmad2 immunoglobulin-like domain-containing protein [Gaiellaceae bacterium]
MRRLLLTTVLAAVAVLVAPVAGASAAVTVTGIRIGNHAPVVRVVVDFTGGNLTQRNVLAVDPEPFPDGRVQIRVHKRGIQSDSEANRRHGVLARINQGTPNALTLDIQAADHRFKYVSYNIFRSPLRLVVDLWKARPPTPNAEILRGRLGCLALDSWRVRAGRATAGGTEQALFEHMFAMTLRKANGAVVKTRGVTATNGSWHRSFRYSIGHRQAGTLEVVDFSEKDGSLVCIAQVQVTLRPPPP